MYSTLLSRLSRCLTNVTSYNSLFVATVAKYSSEQPLSFSGLEYCFGLQTPGCGSTCLAPALTTSRGYNNPNIYLNKQDHEWLPRLWEIYSGMYTPKYRDRCRSLFRQISESILWLSEMLTLTWLRSLINTFGNSWGCSVGNCCTHAIISTTQFTLASLFLHPGVSPSLLCAAAPHVLRLHRTLIPRLVPA
ncbi:hypothetical protein BD779DRAFT_768865 [Infundibulicybe gibba]|nr:hypothetical protein BD779DRAFT_768865 [Infundibulicybe gibba]